jgi:acetyl esterase
MKESGAAGFETLPIEEARKRFVAMCELAGPPEAVNKVDDRTLPGGTRIRVYTPAGPGPKPMLIYFHGGGWVLGSPETIDAPCRRMANAAGCVVVSVDYPLAPEHHFPKPPRRLGSMSGESPSAATVPGATWRPPSRSWPATGKARRWRSSSWSTQ